MPDPIDLRAEIQAELDRRAWSVYRLVQECPTVSRRTIYGYLAGESDATGERIGAIMAALGMSVSSSPGAGP